MENEANRLISDDETESIIGPSPPESAVSSFGTAALEPSQESVSTQADEGEQLFGFRVVPKKRKLYSQNSDLDINLVESGIIEIEKSLKENSVIEATCEREKKANEMLQQVLGKIQMRDESFQDFANLMRSSDNGNSTSDDSGQDFVSTDASRKKLEQTLKALKERVDYFLLVQQETALYVTQAIEKLKELEQQCDAKVAETDRYVSASMRQVTETMEKANQKLAEIEEKLPKVHVKSYVISDNGEKDYKSKFGAPKICGSGQFGPDDFPPYKRKKKIMKTKENSQCSSNSSQRSQTLSESQLTALKLRATATFLSAKYENENNES